MTAATRSFRFGVVFTGATDAAGWAELARRVEGEGFSTLLVADHYDNPMACGPLIMAAATATTTLRVGSYVYNNDFRHPALLAKEAATIDVLSGGRLELGIGAGWAKEEYDEVGLAFDPPSVRADRFEEAIDVITRLLSGETIKHKGEHYELTDLVGSPRPTQARLPLLIGGGGPRMLRLAARVADTVGLVPRSLPGGGLDPEDFTEASIDKKVSWIRAAAAEAGRAAGEPELSVLVFLLCRSIAEAARSPWMPPEVARGSPYALIGDPVAIVDQLVERRDRWGISYYVCFDTDIDTMIPIVRAIR